MNETKIMKTESALKVLSGSVSHSENTQRLLNILKSLAESPSQTVDVRLISMSEAFRVKADTAEGVAITNALKNALDIRIVETQKTVGYAGQLLNHANDDRLENIGGQ